MLVVDRKEGEQILIGNDIVVTLVKCRQTGRARIGVDAPREIPVHRREVADAIATQQIITQHEGPLGDDGGPPGTPELGGMVAFDHSQFDEGGVAADLARLGITHKPNKPR